VHAGALRHSPEFEMGLVAFLVIGLVAGLIGSIVGAIIVLLL